MNRQELATFLESVKDLYPGGVSKESLRACADERTRLSVDKPATGESSATAPRILFLSLESKEPESRNMDLSGTLLIAAIEKGLRLKVEEVEIARASTTDTLIARMRSSKAKLVAVLGEETAIKLGLNDLARGQLHSRDGREILCSVPLARAAMEPSQKRLFWEDLQRLIQHL